jgi:glycosyltransferase involved in cell wall biosynthesis
VPEARVVLAGDGPLRPALQAAAAALPAGAAVLLGERHDVPRLLAAADAFVLPSRSEGLSLSLVEAHGAGRPSVACDVGGNAEVLQDGATGRLVPAGDIAALAAAVADLLGDPVARARQGEAARARYVAGFTHATMVAGYVALYRALRDGRAG